MICDLSLNKMSAPLKSCLALFLLAGLTACAVTKPIVTTRVVEPTVVETPVESVQSGQQLASAPVPAAPTTSNLVSSQGSRLQQADPNRVLTYQNGQPVIQGGGQFSQNQQDLTYLPADSSTVSQPVIQKASTTTSKKTPKKFSSWVLPSRKIVKTPKSLVDEGRNPCALTFDDGPHKTLDPQILSILDQHGIRATFFLIAKSVKRQPELTKEIAARGHEIAHHSWDHDDYKKKNGAGQAADLKRANDVFNNLGIYPTVFRPPYGSFNKKTVSLARQAGLDTFLWTNDPEDWRKRDAATIRSRVNARYTPGSVVLLHSIVPGTVKALPGIIEDLKAKGCQFVTSSEWIAAVSSN